MSAAVKTDEERLREGLTACKNCGGTMLGDGFTVPVRCENADEAAYEGKEPDASPTMCSSTE